MNLVEPSSHVELLYDSVGTYRDDDTDWSPIIPQEPLSLSELNTGFVHCINASSLARQPAEKDGNHLHFNSTEETFLRFPVRLST